MNRTASTRAKAVTALLLAVCSGLVDLVGYLGIYRVFTAHLTGTTIQLARHLVQHDWRPAALATTVFIAYLVGSVAGRALIEVCARRGLRRSATATLAIEAVLLALVARFVPGAPAPLLTVGVMLAMLAAAMGLQTATLTRVGPLTVHTTFVTGMLNKVAQLVSHVFFALYDDRREPNEERRHEVRRDSKRAAFLALVWLSYLIGGIIAAVEFDRRGTSTLYAAAALLLVVIAVDQRWCLAVAEEREQVER